MTGMTLIVVIAAAVAGFVIGAVIGYSTGKTDGNRETAEWYETRMRIERRCA